MGFSYAYDLMTLRQGVYEILSGTFITYCIVYYTVMILSWLHYREMYLRSAYNCVLGYLQINWNLGRDR